MRDVYVIGAYTTVFKKHPGLSFGDLAREAYMGSLEDAGMTTGADINMSSGTSTLTLGAGGLISQGASYFNVGKLTSGAPTNGGVSELAIWASGGDFNAMRRPRKRPAFHPGHRRQRHLGRNQPDFYSPVLEGPDHGRPLLLDHQR